MLKLSLCVVVLLMSFVKSTSQAPFTTLVKEPRFLLNTDSKYKAAKKGDEPAIKALVDDNDSITDGKKIKRTTKDDVDFFKNNALSLNLLNKGENRTSISSQVIHYKLFIANPNEINSYRINRYSIPLMLISKLSTNYDSVLASSAIDVLDYEAAPLTLRIMPSIKVSFETYNDIFFIGFYTDLRGINMHNPKDGSTDLEFVWSNGIGFTYQGDGEAGNYNPDAGEYESGRFSLSVIFQAAKGKNDVISRLFSTNENWVTSFQGYFLFKISDKSKLNLKAGYQYFNQKSKGGIRNNFSIAIGI